MDRDDVDTGTGYGLAPSTHDPRLTEIGPGSALGELLRRSWHPIATSAEVRETPRRVRVLGEDLVLFRTGDARTGLVAERCRHRGASLYFGRVEEDGLRCCFHGWKFDVEGRCLDCATLPEGVGRGDPAFRQPWYHTEERYGLVFAYLGPPAKKPPLMGFDVLEPLGEGEFLEITTNPGYGPEILDYNWLQSYENILDPIHAAYLHLEHSGAQFAGATRGYDPGESLRDLVRRVSWTETEQGVCYTQRSRLPDGGVTKFVVECQLPNLFFIPYHEGELPRRPHRTEHVGWVVPVDDANHRIIQVARVRREGGLRGRAPVQNGKAWRDCTPDELQRFPGDYESRTHGLQQHSIEHLTVSDRGATLLRRRLDSAARSLASEADAPASSCVGTGLRSTVASVVLEEYSPA